MTRSTLLAGAALSVAAPAAAQTDVDPDGAATPGQAGLADIVVTAQKRETKLQDTPISMAVLGERDLADRHIVSLANLENVVPGLRVHPASARPTALQITIRGIGSPPDIYQPTRDQSVGVYVDGVYLGRTQGLGAALFDVERIEVLKGPQGTLFGRNTEGGAISIVTRKPSGKFGLNATAGIGNYGAHEVTAHVDLPAIHNVSIKVDGLLHRRDGIVDNPMAGEPDFGLFDKRGLRLSALWEPTENFNALYSFDTSYDATTPYYSQLLAKGTMATAPLITASPDRFDTALIGIRQQRSIGRTHGHALTLQWQAAGNLTLKSISAYRELSQSLFDVNAMVSVFAPNAPFGRETRARINQDQFSQEFQILGDFASLNFVAGAYYFIEHADDDASSPNTLRWNADGTAYSLIDTPVSTPPVLDRASKTTNKSVAVFAQATWTPPTLQDALHLTVGGRYTRDSKKGSLFIVNGATPTVNGVTSPLLLDQAWNRFDPMVNVSFDVTPDIMAYGKWSTGYKSGGANSRSLIYRAYDPESVSTFEIGAKTEFLDRRVRLNLAAFATRYKNQHVDFAITTPGISRVTAETANAEGIGHIKGIEVDLTVAPATGLTMSASYAYLHTRLPQARDPFTPGNPLVAVLPTFSPRHSASAAIDYRHPVGNAALLVHLDGNYAGFQYLAPSDPTSFSRESFLVNGRLALTDIPLDGGDARLELAAWARNILNNRYHHLRFANALGTFASFNDPRTYGLTATIRY